MIYPIAKGSSSIKYYVPKEDIFDVIHNDHLTIGHRGRNMNDNRNTNKVKKYYSRKHHALLKFVHSLPQKMERYFNIIIEDQTDDNQ